VTWQEPRQAGTSIRIYVSGKSECFENCPTGPLAYCDDLANEQLFATVPAEAGSATVDQPTASSGYCWRVAAQNEAGESPRVLLSGEADATSPGGDGCVTSTLPFPDVNSVLHDLPVTVCLSVDRSSAALGTGVQLTARSSVLANIRIVDVTGEPQWEGYGPSSPCEATVAGTDCVRTVTVSGGLLGFSGDGANLAQAWPVNTDPQQFRAEAGPVDPSINGYASSDWAQSAVVTVSWR
jgi:hypothetical protein